jgi:hypothetical protein
MANMYLPQEVPTPELRVLLEGEDIFLSEIP